MRYVVLLPGDEAVWAAASPEERAATYARHGKFFEQLAARGHQAVGGAELTPSRESTVLRFVDGVRTVTEGPYAETVEQLTGYYEVETEDLDDLLEVCSLLAAPPGEASGPEAIEVRRVVTDEEREQQA